MKKSMCDGPGCGKRMMDSPQARFGSKKGPGGCKCGGKCTKCKEKAESEESEADEPDGDRDDSYSRVAIVTDSMSGYRRFDAPSCNPGNKPCGGRCIPQENDCESTLRRKGNRRLMGGGALLAGAGAAGYGIKKILPAVHADKPLQEALGKAGYSGTEKLKAAATTPMGRKALGLAGATALAGGLGLGAIGAGVNSYQKARKERQNRGDSIWASGFEHEPSESV